MVGTLVSSACNSPCEYGPTRHIKANVTVTSVPRTEGGCTNDPVEIRVEWDTGSEWIQTTDHRDMPRACAAGLGLVDGAELDILVSENTGGGQSFPIAPCERYHFSIPDFFWDACDAACDEPMTACPSSPPFAGSYCAGKWSCPYQETVFCSANAAWIDLYECIGNAWTSKQVPTCGVCGVSCDPPPPECLTCGMVIDPLPPDQITFCNDTSATLYNAVWTCACAVGEPCESICNTTPGPSMCKDGIISMECASCVTNEPAPKGCAELFAACVNDL